MMQFNRLLDFEVWSVLSSLDRGHPDQSAHSVHDTAP
jgi:hypothetical protein